VLEAKQLTVEEFEQIAALPENADKRLEFIGGRIVEVVSSNYSSLLASFVGTMVNMFVLQHRLGFVSTTDGGYAIGTERYIPDVAFITFAKQPEPLIKPYVPVAPDLAVEVLSPSNDDSEITDKVVSYLMAGVLVWIADPERKIIKVYAPNESPKTLTLDDTLDGGKVLPGFTLSVRSLFELRLGV
jgi:Uma2 family endonuclease